MRRTLLPHPWLLWLFTQCWAHRLAEGDPDRPGARARVVRVKGWRTALVETSWGQRQTVEWV